MERTEAKKSKFKAWAFAIFVWVFLCVWLTGMTAGLMAGACRNDRYDGAKKLRFCNISLAAGYIFNVSSLEQAKGAIIHLEKGIALAQISKTDLALEEFYKALRDAKSKTGPWERQLHQRMDQIKDRSALAVWASVVQSLK
ncbi:hypothetical protein [Tateyamaria omphalii]|uniref:Uncharacterized protein n=1 Tax=Tateyamaria omphalii TaxID=299262 RepID=A0A1P8MSK7_9RHOB|nr:hypothetical protein [Tateyamaria omphalii]APX11060.1 hypothetical protein BWR18_04680 [Tateyamaria omphalii]